MGLSLMNMVGLSSSVHIALIACYWKFFLLHYIQVLSQYRLFKADHAYLTFFAAETCWPKIWCNIRDKYQQRILQITQEWWLRSCDPCGTEEGWDAEKCLLIKLKRLIVQSVDGYLLEGVLSRDSVVGTATGYGLGDRGFGFSSPGKVKNFLFSTSSRPVLGTTQPPT
jgi:hypothetical protein